MSDWTMVGADLEHPGAAALDSFVCRAQAGDEAALQSLLDQFRPLLRSRMRHVWSVLQEHMPVVEWADVEGQVHLLFLTRLHSFRPGDGVYFAHYMARMLELDCRGWVREQREKSALPFSQVLTSDGDEADLETWAGVDAGTGATTLDAAVSLRQALQVLTEPQRQVLWSCCVLGHTEHEAARELGLARSTVRNRLALGLSRLRTFFEETPASTRTGRKSSAVDSDNAVWLRRMFMANDDKRPDLVGIGAGRAIMLQGIFDFEATGLKTSRLLSPKLTYTVPPGHVVGIRFFRIGVICDQLVCVSSVVNGMPHRLVPVAANATTHVSLAIVDPIVAGSQIEIHIASQAAGTAIVDIGCLQMPA